jgi:hypothetical protein
MFDEWMGSLPRKNQWKKLVTIYFLISLEYSIKNNKRMIGVTYSE